MNGEQTLQALEAFGNRRLEEYQAKLMELPKKARTERKALTILINTLSNCNGFLRICYTQPLYSREFYQIREQRVFSFYHYFDDARASYEALSEEEKQSFLIYAFGTSMVRRNLYEPSLEMLGDAGETKNTEKWFARELIINTIRELLLCWQNWWSENGVIECKVIV